ncbi:MAG: hypothetical protein KC502_00015 [Myxococcales bacterium]|nr:hypothetical protein [Myxococcales bacterium]
MTQSTRKRALLFLICALLCVPAIASAGSVEYLTNQSADYIRTFSRNAAVDGVDIVSFNPAGTTWLKDGIHLSLSNQTLIGEYNIKYEGKEYASPVTVPALPSLHAAWKSGNIAAFASVTVPSGGGSLDYKEGIPYLIPLVAYADKKGADKTPKNGSFQGSSIFYGVTLGGAYKIMDMISVSLAARVVMAKKSYQGSVDYGAGETSLDVNKEATGFSGIAGLTVRPGFGLTIGLRYELKTAMKFKTTQNKPFQNFIADDKLTDTALRTFLDGAEEDRDMPSVLGFGLAWSGFGLTVSTSVHMYDTEGADGEKDYAGLPGIGAGAYVKSWDDDYENGWDAAISVEYQINPSLLVSVGYIKAKIGGSEKTYSDFEFALDSDSIGLGARYNITSDLAVTLGVSKTFYTEGKNKALAPLVAEGPETFNKDVLDIALGVAYRL